MQATIEKTTDEIRAEYRAIRRRAVYERALNAEHFDRECARYIEEVFNFEIREVGPKTWLNTAKRVTFTCRRCAGTGKFVTYVENGQPKSPSGEACFRCDGKGYQTDADAKRNSYYDQHRKIYL